MSTITLLQPAKLVLGRGALTQCAQDLNARGFRRILVVTSPPTARLAGPLRELPGVTIYDAIDREPTVAMFERLLLEVRESAPDAVVGLGGGSALDAAKLAAALVHNARPVREVLGINLLSGRRTYLVCVPTTSGTGSEVSPNAILLDEGDHTKKAAISPYLVPDASYLDPELARSMPPEVTASSGMDALTHCIETYANRAAHPATDLYALEGVRLIGSSLVRAFQQGDDLEARQNMMRASLYGGLCLGPVNTAAVHALAYPLGGEFGVPHGASNAVLLPHVLEFNLSAMPERYAEIAMALGAPAHPDPVQTARAGIERIRELMQRCGLPRTLSDLGIPASAIPKMVVSAMKVQRLLKNNPRPVTEEDAERIYRAALA